MPHPPHGCPRGHSSFHLSRLSPPFRMQPGSASSPARLPRSPARHGAGPDPGKSSPIPHPENVPFQQKWTRGWHSTRCRHVTRSRESTGEGTAAPRDGGRGTEKASQPWGLHFTSDLRRTPTTKTGRAKPRGRRRVTGRTGRGDGSGRSPHNEGPAPGVGAARHGHLQPGRAERPKCGRADRADEGAQGSVSFHLMLSQIAARGQKPPSPRTVLRSRARSDGLRG